MLWNTFYSSKYRNLRKLNPLALLSVHPPQMLVHVCPRPRGFKRGRRQRLGGLIESLTSAGGSTSSHCCYCCSVRQHLRLHTSPRVLISSHSKPVACDVETRARTSRVPLGNHRPNPRLIAGEAGTAPWMRARQGEVGALIFEALHFPLARWHQGGFTGWWFAVVEEQPVRSTTHTSVP